jgi:pantoate--beta-alanine ligase
VEIFKTRSEMQNWSAGKKAGGRTLSFVPTMGFLHQGHLSLLKRGKPLCDELVLSIFVNPTQFAPGEDLDAYPRSIEKDLKLAESAGVTAVFLPTVKEMYGHNFQTRVTLEHLPSHLCGRSRPDHFGGVALVVTKLFNIVMPDVAIFGKKDFQQFQIIRQMTRDLDFNIEIIGGDIVREPDGLAMSSRNAYLTTEQRQSALCLSQALAMARQLVAGGESNSDKIRQAMADHINGADHTAIDYIEICDPETLAPAGRIQGEVLVALAVQVGRSRLIDNALMAPSQ